MRQRASSLHSRITMPGVLEQQNTREPRERYTRDTKRKGKSQRILSCRLGMSLIYKKKVFKMLRESTILSFCPLYHLMLIAVIYTPAGHSHIRIMFNLSKTSLLFHIFSVS